jgi:hypothetical protein
MDADPIPVRGDRHERPVADEYRDADGAQPFSNAPADLARPLACLAA